MHWYKHLSSISSKNPFYKLIISNIDFQADISDIEHYITDHIDYKYDSRPGGSHRG